MIKIRKHETETYTHLVIQLRELSEIMHYAQSQETLIELIDELLHRVAYIDNVVVDKNEYGTGETDGTFKVGYRGSGKEDTERSNGEEDSDNRTESSNAREYRSKQSSSNSKKTRRSSDLSDSK